MTKSKKGREREREDARGTVDGRWFFVASRRHAIPYIPRSASADLDYARNYAIFQQCTLEQRGRAP